MKLLSHRWIGWALVMVLAASGCSKSSRFEDHLARGAAYRTSGEFSKALIELENARRIQPNDTRVLELLAGIRAEQGALLQAAQMVQRYGLKLKDLDLRVRLAEFYLQNGSHAAARGELIAVLDQQPTHHEAIVLLCSPAFPADYDDDTDKRLQEIESKHLDDVSLVLGRGAMAMRHKQFEIAETLTRKAIERAPQLPRAHLQLAHILSFGTNRAASEQAFEQAGRLAPARSPIRTAYAQALLASGKTQPARQWLMEQLKQAPDYAPATLALARVAYQEQAYDEAIASIDRILTEDSLNFEARLLRSQVRLARRETDLNAKEWQRFDESLAPNALIKLHTARAFAANRSMDRAYEFVRQSITLSSNRLDSVALESRILQARLELDRGQPLAALDVFQAIPASARNVEMRILQIDALRGLKRWDEAASECQALVLLDSRNGLFPFLLGSVMREQGQVAAARSAFQKSLEVNPGNVLVTAEWVDLELAEKNYNQALSVIRSAASKATNSAVLKFLEGRVYAAQTQWGEAESMLRNAIQLDADLAGAYQLLSSMQVSRTNWTGAAQEMEGLVGRQTNNIPAWMMLGVIFEKMGDVARGADSYERVLSLNPQFVPALNNLASLYSDEPARVPRALALAEQARKLAPEDPTVADTLGWARYRKGDFDGALPLLRFAADRIPENSEIQYHLGMTLAMLGQAESAKSSLEAALKGSEEYRGRSEATQRLAALQRGTQTSSLSGSADEWEKALQSDPSDINMRLRLASHYTQRNDYEKAARHYEAALSSNSRLPQGLLRLAELYAGPLKQPARALELARKAYDASPKDPDAAALLGRMMLASGDHTFAYTLLLTASQSSTRDEVAHDFARAAYAVGKVQEAEQVMSRLAGSSKNTSLSASAREFLDLHRFYSRSSNAGQLDATTAAERVSKALTSEPSSLPARMAQAALLRSAGKGPEAVTLYDLILRDYPKFTPAQRELAFVCSEQPGLQAKAYDAARRARETLPEDVELGRLLGRLAYGRGEFALAAGLMLSVERQKSGDPEVLFYLGMSQVRTRQESDGRNNLERAIAAGLAEPFLSQARRSLASP